MKSYSTRNYSVNDFREWNERDQLVLTPKFQRRGVWSPKAKSYLLDTIIRGRPMPKLFIRQQTNPKINTTIREVVDGQQRLRAVLDFLADGFKVAKVHNEDVGGVFYSKLPDTVQRSILSYEFAVDVLVDAEDRDLYDIFARINTYSVKLSRQELLHSQWFGQFRQSAYTLALEFEKFWTNNGIFTSKEIMRMREAELTSELLIAMIVGIQTNKVIGSYYKKFDEDMPKRATYEEEFRKTMDVVGEIMAGTLKASNFSRPYLYYTLFTTIYHQLHGLPTGTFAKARIRKADHVKIRNALEQADQLLELDEKELTAEQRKFVNKDAATDATPRRERTEYLCKKVVEVL